MYTSVVDVMVFIPFDSSPIDGLVEDKGRGKVSEIEDSKCSKHPQHGVPVTLDTVRQALATAYERLWRDIITC